MAFTVLRLVGSAGPPVTGSAALTVPLPAFSAAGTFDANGVLAKGAAAVQANSIYAMTYYTEQSPALYGWELHRAQHSGFSWDGLAPLAGAEVDAFIPTDGRPFVALLSEDTNQMNGAVTAADGRDRWDTHGATYFSARFSALETARLAGHVSDYRVLTGTCLPIDAAAAGTFTETARLAYNTEKKAWLGANSSRVVIADHGDPTTSLIGNPANFNTYFQSVANGGDGIHPNGAGHQYMFSAIWEPALRSALAAMTLNPVPAWMVQLASDIEALAVGVHLVGAEVPGRNFVTLSGGGKVQEVGGGWRWARALTATGGTDGTRPSYTSTSPAHATFTGAETISLLPFPAGGSTTVDPDNSHLLYQADTGDRYAMSAVAAFPTLPASEQTFVSHAGLMELKVNAGGTARFVTTTGASITLGTVPADSTPRIFHCCRTDAGGTRLRGRIGAGSVVNTAMTLNNFGSLGNFMVGGAHPGYNQTTNVMNPITDTCPGVFYGVFHYALDAGAVVTSAVDDLVNTAAVAHLGATA